MLFDNHGRQISYLRLAVTDRCNLRCFYCMPGHGIDWLSRTELLNYDEMLRICSILVKMGIDKIRITGGEPFLRKGLMPFLAALSQLNGLRHISITTNGVLTAPYISELKKLGIRCVNLSLDTLDAGRFFSITRRNEFDAVMHTLNQLLHHNMHIKINAVVMAKHNIDDILPLVQLTKDMPVDVRFIEEMPFNGHSHTYQGLEWDHIRIRQHIAHHYPDIYKINDAPFSTAYNYHIPGHKGNIGIIAAYSRTFCGSCNRIRLTPLGELKTCLYQPNGLDVKNLLRLGCTNSELISHLQSSIGNRPANGWEAQREHDMNSPAQQSMATIGG